MRMSSFVVATVLCAASTLQATEVIVPHVGRLLGDADVPVEGIRTLRFGLYTRVSDSPGEQNLVWEETYPNVEFSNGFYTVALGDPEGGRAPLDLDHLLSVSALWLEVTIFENDSPVPLSPRMRMSPAFAAARAADATHLGGLSAHDYLTRADFEDFRAELTGGDGTSGLSIPWERLTGLPDGFADGIDDGLRQVAVTGSALEGAGTGDSPLQVRNGGIGTAQLADGAVTADKLAPGAVDPSIIPNNSIAPPKLTLCPEGQILKVQSGEWQCGFDTGAGGTLSFNVLAPLEQIPGEENLPATLQLQDKGILTSKLADDVVDASRLKTDEASLGKLTGGALTSRQGAIGVGVDAPTARFEIAHHAATGTEGVGMASHKQGETTVTVSGGNFNDQVGPGDLIELGNFGWRTVTAVAANGESLTLGSGYDTSFTGTFRVRRATFRLANVTQTGLGNVGIGTTAPQVPLHVAGTMALDAANPTIYTGMGAADQDRYLHLVNSPHARNAAGLKTGGLLVSDSFSYANPGETDAVVKGTLAVGKAKADYTLDVSGSLASDFSNIAPSAGRATVQNIVLYSWCASRYPTFRYLEVKGNNQTCAQKCADSERSGSGCLGRTGTGGNSSPYTVYNCTSTTPTDARFCCCSW